MGALECAFHRAFFDALNVALFDLEVHVGGGVSPSRDNSIENWQHVQQENASVTFSQTRFIRLFCEIAPVCMCLLCAAIFLH